MSCARLGVGKIGGELGNPQGSLYKQYRGYSNQAEVTLVQVTLLESEQINWWLGGFIEGEASWSIALKLSSAATLGIQVVPIFGISQHESGKGALERLQKTLGGCGRLFIKSRTKNGA